MKRLKFSLAFLAFFAVNHVANAAFSLQKPNPKQIKDSVLKVEKSSVQKEKILVKDSLPRVTGITLVRAVTDTNPDTADVEASDKIYNKQQHKGNGQLLLSS
ncbi:hypothetical protein ABIB62_004731 [Mucilaginibacter sp. UYP25]|uniref:hypothetical protein n=1 Tax=unclassified Mucilaginibacter TaxID=2617802 RepID=UPI00339879AB